MSCTHTAPRAHHPTSPLTVSYINEYELPEDARDRPFNGFRITATDKAASVVAEASHLLRSYEGHRAPRKRKRKAEDLKTFNRQVEAVVCDLIHRELTCPGGWIAIPLSNTILGSRDRYKSKAFSKTIKRVLKYMETPEMGYVEYRKGVWAPSDRNLNILSTIRAGERLRDRIRECGLTCADIKLDDAQEVIVLKAAKKGHNDTGTWLQYEDTEQTSACRADMEFINDVLSKADIKYLGHKDEPVVDTTDRRLWRCFNNGSFEQGGRLFGGFWMPMPKVKRRGILIQGAPTITLDFGQMNARILYGIAGHDYIGVDAYTIPRFEEYRDGVKAVFNAMLHRTTPMTKKPRGVAELFHKTVHIKEITTGIIMAHRPIADLFYRGIGLRLLYEESQILLEVLRRLFTQGIVALPIHDAVIVAEHHQKEATTAMLSVFQERTGIEGVVKVEK